jgi:enoyl-CoA hydratase/carnithine racemase
MTSEHILVETRGDGRAPACRLITLNRPKAAERAATTR